MAISPMPQGATLPALTIAVSNDRGDPIALSGTTLTLLIRSLRPIVDTPGAGTWTIVGTICTLSSSISAGASVSSLPCSATSTALPGGSVITVSSGGNAENFTVVGSGCSLGATSIPVVTQTAAHNHSSADSISGVNLATYAWAAADTAKTGNYVLLVKIATGSGTYITDAQTWNVVAI